MIPVANNMCRHTPSCDGKLADEGVCQHAKHYQTKQMHIIKLETNR